MYQRRVSPLGCILIVAGVAVVLAVVFLGLSPRLASTSPAAEAAGMSSRSPITLTFSQVMDLASAQEHVTINPPAAGSFEASADGRRLKFTPRLAWPIGSTVVISVSAGARSRLGLTMLTGRTWQFTVGEPRVAYLLDTGGLTNLWAFQPNAEGAVPAQITNAAQDVLDFAPGPDGTQLVYAMMREDGGSDLRQIGVDGSGDALLLECPGEMCRAAQWSPDGARIAFERRPALSAEATASAARESHVAVLDLATGEVAAVEPQQANTLSARWSPDGRLAYYNADSQQIVVAAAGAGSDQTIANGSGEMGAWSLDGLGLIFPEIVLVSDTAAAPTPTATVGQTGPPGVVTFYSHLIRVETDSRARQELSTEPLVEDAAAIPSPTGTWIAFGRKFLDAARWTPGRQLWLMRPDGSEAHPLTSAGDFQHSGFVWSPDGGRLAYTRFDLATPGALPEVWTINTDGSDARALIAGGYLPAWLP